MNQRKVAQAVDRTVKKGLKVTQKVVRNLIQNAPKREVSIVESIKGLTGEKHFFEESISVKDVKTLLDDKTGAAGDAQKTEGLKWLLAQISKANDVSQFFPDVVKLTARKNFELKRFVYIYLTHYADFDSSCRELAVLSVNQFLNDMKNPNELIRALALRVLASLRVPDIVQIQLFELRRMIKDISSYVRKTVAHAVPKLFQLDNKLKPDLIAIIDALLGDNHTNVLGSAIAAFTEVCPQHYDLLHPHFRKLCCKLADMDEWGQIATINVLCRYARAFFTAPPKRDPEADDIVWSAAKDAPSRSRISSVTYTNSSSVDTGTFYGNDDDSDEADQGDASKDPVTVSDDMAGLVIGDSVAKEYAMVEDHRLVIKCALQLLQSRNSGVVMAACTLYYYLGSGSPSVLIDIARVFCRFLCSSQEIAFLLLKNITRFSARWPMMFKNHLQLFIVSPCDSVCALPCLPTVVLAHIFYCDCWLPRSRCMKHARNIAQDGSKHMKIQIMMHILDENNAEIIIKELQRLVRGFEIGIAVRAIQGLCTVAARFPEYINGCLHGLMALLALRTHQDIMSAAASGVRLLLAASTKHSRSLDAAEKNGHNEKVAKVVNKLSRMIKHVTLPGARKSILRILYEYEQHLNTKLDLLRLLLKDFPSEDVGVKMQIVEFAVKLTVVNADNSETLPTILKLLRYALDLSKRDPDDHVRDRARFLDSVILSDRLSLRTGAADKFRAILASRFSTLVDSAGTQEPEDSTAKLTLGSMSFQVGKIIPGYVGMPDFAPKPTDPALRDGPSLGSAQNESASDTTDDDSSSDSSDDEGTGSDSSDDDESDDSTSSSSSSNTPQQARKAKTKSDLIQLGGSDDSSSSSSDDDADDAPVVEPAVTNGLFDGFFDNVAPADSKKAISTKKTTKSKQKAKPVAKPSSSSSGGSSGSSSSGSGSSSEEESSEDLVKAAKAPAPAPAPVSKAPDLFDAFSSIENDAPITAQPPASTSVDPMSFFDEIVSTTPPVSAPAPASSSDKKSKKKSRSNSANAHDSITDLFSGDGGALPPTLSSNYADPVPETTGELLDPSYGVKEDLTDDYGGPDDFGAADDFGSLASVDMSSEAVAAASAAAQKAPSVPLRKHTLLSLTKGNQFSVTAVYTRRPSEHGAEYTDVELTMVNQRNRDIDNISLETPSGGWPGGVKVIPFERIRSLKANSTEVTHVHLKLMDRDTELPFQLHTENGPVQMKLKPPLGELLRPMPIDTEKFEKRRKVLTGFMESSATVKRALPLSQLAQRVRSWAAVHCVSESPQQCCFAGLTASEAKVVLFAAEKVSDGVKVSVYSDDVMLSAFFLPMMKAAVHT